MWNTRWITALVLPALMLGLAWGETKPAAPKGATKADSLKADSRTLLSDSAIRQAQMKRQFADLLEQLRLIAKSKAASSDQKDRDLAKVIEAAIKKASDKNIAGSFDNLINAMKKPGASKDLDSLQDAIQKNARLRKAIKEMVSLLLQDNREKKLAERREELTKLIKEIKALKGREARLQALTEMGKKKPEELKAVQEKLRKATEEVLKKLTPKDADDKKKLASDLEKLRAALDEADKSKIDAILKKMNGSIKNMKTAEGKLGKGDAEGAADSEGGAVKDLGDVLKILDDLLNQVREEERERKLRNLLARVEKMLKLEEEIRDGTEALDKEIRKTGKTATAAHGAKAVKLADKQHLVWKEAGSALELLKEEGSAPSFLEGLEQVDKDALIVKGRLNRTDVGKLTLAIEDDMIDSLKDMVKALKKALQDGETPEPPTPGDPGNPDPIRKRPLVNFVQQLKMVHALQRRLNDRTKLYGRQYPGEQVPEGKTAKEKELYKSIRSELKDLTGRQKKLSGITKHLGKQAVGTGGTRID